MSKKRIKRILKSRKLGTKNIINKDNYDFYGDIKLLNDSDILFDIRVCDDIEGRLIKNIKAIKSNKLLEYVVELCVNERDPLKKVYFEVMAYNDSEYVGNLIILKKSDYKIIKQSTEIDIDIKMPDARIVYVDNNGNEINNGWISVKDRLPENDDDVICLFIGWDRFEFQKVLSYDTVAKEWSEDIYVQYWRELENTKGLEFDYGNY